MQLYKMNDIINKFLSAGDKFMSEIHLRQPQLSTVLVDGLPKTKKKCNSLKKLEIQNMFKEMN